MKHRVLDIKNLRINFYTVDGTAKILNGVNLSIDENEVVGLVGESSCGKSVTAKTVLNTLSIPPAKIIDGKICLNGRNVLDCGTKERERYTRGNVSYVPQDPMTSLNPVFTIGHQIVDLIKWQDKKRANIRSFFQIGIRNENSRDTAVELLKKVHLASPEEILKRYPIELSGGMRQRVLIAMSLIGKRTLLIADEPTTALDVTVQKNILNLIEEKVREESLSVLYITHNLGVAKRLCERIYVMYSGDIVESAKTKDLLENPLHPYTRGLIDSIPKLMSEKFEGINGRIPDYFNPPGGCRFYPRCKYMMDICKTDKPGFTKSDKSNIVACHLYQNGKGIKNE
jgi:peptide/nickel transport system ATP-binding protein